ncbi:hypothetical protein [Pseudomonas syringae]|uniref:hypothetical protein n=1 Tax=Pseudomonas syringae TaxID=317 RepID=UPI003F7780A8
MAAHSNAHADRQSLAPAACDMADQQEILMGKLGLSLIGFLLLAIAVGLLGTISPY